MKLVWTWHAGFETWYLAMVREEGDSGPQMRLLAGITSAGEKWKITSILVRGVYQFRDLPLVDKIEDAKRYAETVWRLENAQ